MKLVSDFKDFLRDTVNLNKTRIDLLEERVETIKSFLRDSDWERMRAAKTVCLDLVISSKSMAYVMRYSDFPH